ncbi:MAG: hypothetical protein FJ265_15620, partial [Planctomycetes bacterium]|nr:hypothetical protein [Planctomycetota bacterium]
MDPRLPASLVWGCLFAVPAAAVAPWCLPAGAALAGLGILFAASRHPHRFAGLWALPAVLAGLRAPEAPPAWPRCGPVVLAGTVREVVHGPAGETTLRLGAPGVGARLHVTGTLEALPGDRILGTVRLAAAAVPGQAPALRAPAAALRVVPGGPSWTRSCAAAPRALERELQRLLPGERGALLATLALGRGTSTDKDLAAAHRATGLSHLLAVSGAHAAMLAWLLGLGAGRRAVQLAAGRARTLVALAVLFVYAGITGNEPPVLRTVVAFALGSLGTQLGRRTTLATALLAPALLTALTEPAALLGPSFGLSYAAVLGLAAAGPPGQGFLRRWFWSPLCASAWATLATAPLTLLWFGQVAPWTVLLTPLLAPLVALLLLGSLVAAVLGLVVPGAANLLALLLGPLADLYANAVQAADLLPFTPVHAPWVPPPWALLLAASAAALALLGWPDRRGLAAAAAALALVHFVPTVGPGQPRLALLAVGHGQAALAVLPDGARVAIDCGSIQQPERAARCLAAASSVRSLDLLVITHADQDHHNGVSALLGRVPIRRAVLPEGLAGSATERALLAHGVAVQRLPGGAAATPLPGLRVAAPALPAGARDNDASLWVTVDLGGCRALLTGDAQRDGVAAALAQGIAEPCD